ncbi:MAG TPA: dihydrodipicolinate synthase family protein [Gemmatimonadales bacterium]|nr:dihydrodipicolinate synthase family protein [Gemmatimonadales bacterium]
MQLNGILAAATTPFDEPGEVDVAAFRRNAEFLLDSPLAGLVLFGSTGEGVLVDREERGAMLAAAREMLGERLLLAGTGAESTRATIRLGRDAAQAGADAVLVQPPGFFRSLMTTPALLDHYTRVADASPVPVVLYQVPAPFRSVDLDLPLIARLSEHPNIVGVKDSSGDVAALRELERTSGEGFAVIVGTAAVLQDALDAGACAGILALAAIAPHECTAIYRHWQSGEREEAARVQAVAAGLHRAVVGRFSVPGVKAALDYLGLPGGRPRSPMQALGPAERAIVAEAMKAAARIPQ